MYGSDKSIRGLGIASGNISPSLQEQKAIFHQMTQFIKVFITVTLFFTILPWRNHGLHPCRNQIGQDIIYVLPLICQQSFCGSTLYQVDSFFTIRSGTFCNKDSDWHTIRIHGQMYFDVKHPFVLDIP